MTTSSSFAASRAKTAGFAETVRLADDLTLGSTIAVGAGDASLAPTSTGGFEVAQSLRETRRSVLPSLRADASGAFQLVHAPAERYRLGRVLGVGGMGEALQADDIDIGRPIAVKRMLPEAATPTGLARFVEEVRIVGSLDHPNVVPVHDVGVDGEGRFYFVMKFCNGESLESVVEKLAAGDLPTHARWPWERRVDVFMKMLRALEYAHAQGILHRDIKPANVMVGEYGEVWLMDWGIAKRGAGTETGRSPNVAALSGLPSVSTTRMGDLLGTPAYMSPEQARGELHRLDARSDLYSACVLFYELLTTRHYLDDHMTSFPALFEALEKIPANPFRDGGSARAGQGPVPAELLHLLKRGLAKRPEDRFQSAAELLERLERRAAGEIEIECPVTATKSAIGSLVRWIDRHPTSVAMLTPVVVLALVGLVVAVVVLALLLATR